jgi:iron complex transport system substrate-binding protein
MKIYLFILISLFIFFPQNGFAEKKVFDQLKREILVPDSPKRIVSLAPNVTEIIFALKKDDILAGVTLFSDYPEKAKTLPKVGSYVRLNIEKIISLKPDLCIAIKDGNPKYVIDKLEMLNIPVYAVDPRDLNSVIETIIEIGELLNASKNAEKLAYDMRKRIKKIKKLAAKAKTKPKVFFQIDTENIISVGTNTFLHQLIVLSGGKNLAEGKTAYPRFNIEKVIMMAPDIIIITSMKEAGAFEKAKRDWQRFKSIPAVKNEKILLADADILNRPSPSLVDGLEWLFSVLHPELIEIK